MDDPASASVAAPREGLMVRKCGQCGYSLNGLPDRGNCPECGHAFCPEEIVIFGWIIEPRRGNAGFARSTNIGAIVLIPLVQIVGWLFTGDWVIALAFSGAVAATALGVALYERRQAGKPAGSAQFRLSAAGFGCREGVGGVKIRRWPNRTLWMIAPQGPDAYRLTVRRKVRFRRLLPIGFVAPVTFDFRATGEEMRALRERIDRCILLPAGRSAESKSAMAARET